MTRLTIAYDVTPETANRTCEAHRLKSDGGRLVWSRCKKSAAVTIHDRALCPVHFGHFAAYGRMDLSGKEELLDLSRWKVNPETGTVERIDPS